MFAGWQLVKRNLMSPRVKEPLTLEYALLGFLRAGPAHAYEIHQRLSQTEVLGLVWRLKQRQVYALLERLEEENYVEWSLNEGRALPI
jgi:DNA-binding PadR family transcriptional regulator